MRKIISTLAICALLLGGVSVVETTPVQGSAITQATAHVGHYCGHHNHYWNYLKYPFTRERFQRHYNKKSHWHVYALQEFRKQPSGFHKWLTKATIYRRC